MLPMTTGISEKLEIFPGEVRDQGALLLVWRTKVQQTFLLAHGAQLSLGRREEAASMLWEFCL